MDQELKRKDPFLKTQKSPSASPAKTNTEVTRHISSQVKHQVWMRDQGQCTYFDLVTKRKCESEHKLTYEHIQPFSIGGANTTENLRLLCASHNALLALNVFGREKMRSFMSQ